MGDPIIDEPADRESKIFTLEEARALLPEVRELIARFNLARTAASEVVTNLDHIEKSRTRQNATAVGRPLREAREELGAQAEAMRLVIRTLHDLGVEIKRLDPALLDFPMLMGDRVVCLCWQEGEAAISFWHETSTGFAGRQPLR